MSVKILNLLPVTGCVDTGNVQVYVQIFGV